MHETPFDAKGSMVRWVESPGHMPARVFVHGLGGTGAAIFGDVAADRRPGGNRTLVLDLPGHGHSDRPDGAMRSSGGIPTFLEHLIAVWRSSCLVNTKTSRIGRGCAPKSAAPGSSLTVRQEPRPEDADLQVRGDS